jgi:predicted dehydrogenase
MQTKLRWGVLGTAAIATGRTIPAMLAADRASLLAIGSRDGDKARKVAQQFSIPRAYGNYAELLADPDIDAVYVPLPNRLHFEWSARALEAGKHVLCEKPLCMTSKDVEALCRIRDRSNRHIEEAFGYRNHPQWRKLDELLKSSAIGEVHAVYAVLAKQFLDPNDIRNNLAEGGGSLYDLGSYAISACNLILGEAPQRVVATLDRDPDFGTDRLSTALLDYGGRHAMISAATQSGPAAWATHQQLSVLGSSGWLRLDFPFAQARPTACRIELGDCNSVGSLPTSTFTYEPVNQYLEQVQRFSRLVLGDDVPTWAIEDSLITMRILESIFESGRCNQWRDVAAVAMSRPGS